MKLLLLPVLFFLAVINLSLAQNMQEQNADEFLTRYLELKRFNGAVLVANQQEILYSKGFGLADYEHNIPIKDNTKFAITGISEQFTAYLALKIVEQRGLSLTAPVKDFIGNFDLAHMDSITLHHLLSHTSGLPDYPLIHELPKQQAFSKEDLIAHIQNLSAESVQRSNYNYSKLNYNLVGIILEEVTGKRYGQLLDEYIIEPIGMQNTSLDNGLRLNENIARGYTNPDIAAGWVNAPYLDPANTFAAIGIVSTTADLLHWNNYIRENLLTDQVLQDMLGSGESGIGYGFHVTRNEDGNIAEIRSTGVYSSGFNSFSSLNLDSNLTVIALGNNRNPSSAAIVDGLHAIFTNQDYKLPLPRKTVQVDSSELQKLPGDYKINENVTIKILLEEDRLFVNDGMRPKFELFPQSKNHFFLEGTDAEIEFIENEEGIITRIALKDDGFTNGYAEKVHN